jgi:hypothetical protein
MKSDPQVKLDKTAFSVGSLHDKMEEILYWRGKTPIERLAAVEQIRQILYDYDPATTRLQRILEITQLKSS